MDECPRGSIVSPTSRANNSQ